MKGEVDRLEGAARACLERVETLFSEAHAAVEARRQAVVEQINSVRDAKLKVLRAQLDTIQAEKDKVLFLFHSLFVAPSANIFKCMLTINLMAACPK